MKLKELSLHQGLEHCGAVLFRRLLFLAGEKTLDEATALSLVTISAGPEKSLADLSGAATFG
jgi:hypothetical protein